MNANTKYKTPKELKGKITSFFNKYEKSGRIPTIEMLGVHLGMGRKSILNYQGDSRFKKIITDAKDKITAFKVEAMLNGEGSTAGIIFDLKNNAGFKDKTEVEQTNLNHDLTNLSEEDLKKKLKELNNES